MITIFKDKKDIPKDKEYIEFNDLFFNQNTGTRLDERARDFIKSIDDTEVLDEYSIKSKFTAFALSTECLSTGCKTVLNVLYNPDKVFSIKECGMNAARVLYDLKEGAVYSDYAVIPFEFTEASVVDSEGERVINDYEELKEWWSDEE